MIATLNVCTTVTVSPLHSTPSLHLSRGQKQTWQFISGSAAATAARMAGMAKAMAAIEGKGRQAWEAAAAAGGIHNESGDPLSRQFPLP